MLIGVNSEYLTTGHHPISFLIFSVEEEPTWRREGSPEAVARLDTVSVFQ
jgi:hypothetical protein